MGFSKLSEFDGQPRPELATGELHGGGHYNPNQPRVPAGHHDGGQWTPMALAASAGSDDGRVLSDASADNNWKLWAQYAAGGNEPNRQHQNGVEAAKQIYLRDGYSVVVSSAVAVDVPGFETPRFYDFIVQDPKTKEVIGVEVKTTFFDTIRLNSDQVPKDVAVVQGGARARVLDYEISGVSYITYCNGCAAVDVRTAVLRAALVTARIPFRHGTKPGETLP